MFVKWGGMSAAVIDGSDMSARSFTTGSKIVTGLGRRVTRSPAATGAAIDAISMNDSPSPGNSRCTIPCKASAIFLTATYSPPWRIEPLMSRIRLVAHLGVLRVSCTTRSRGSSRRGRSRPWRSMQLTNDPGMSRWAGESPNSHSRVGTVSTVPSPTGSAACRPVREGARAEKIRSRSFPWKSRRALGVSPKPFFPRSNPCSAAILAASSSTRALSRAKSSSSPEET